MKESCVTHAGDMVVIRKDYVRLCGGSHAHAAVLDVLEFLTNGKISLLEVIDDLSDPWVEASINRLVDACVGLYGRTTLLRCLDDLSARGIVLVRSPGRGINNSYLLDYKLLQKLLAGGSVFTMSAEDSPSPILDPTSPELDGGVSGPESNFGLANKEDAVRNKNAVEETSVGSTDCSFQAFVKIFLSRYNRARGTRLESNRQDKRKTLDWLADRSESQDDILSALDRFTEDSYWAKDRYPLPAFRSQFKKYLEIAIVRTVQVDVPIKEPQPSTAIATVPDWKTDVLYNEYLAVRLKYTGRVTPKEALAAYSHWPSDPVQKRACIEDMEFVGNKASEPKYVPGMIKHLASEPWTAIRVKPMSDEEAKLEARVARFKAKRAARGVYA